MNVAQWLNAIGLGQYEANFRENKIDFDVLADLTDGDLQELGVPIGDRRRLLRAIAELGAQQSLTTQARRTPAAPAPAQSFAQLDSAERRPITVMFCDLVGSTELAAALDVEDWRNLLNSYLNEASKAVTALGGHVVKMLGDGLMAVFGYPRAQENDAERAVRAVLAIQRALADLNARNAKTGAPALAARVGLDMGPVVVDAAGEVFGRCAERRRACTERSRARDRARHRASAAADGRAFCGRRQGRASPQGRAGAGRALSHRAGERRPTRRRADSDAAGRAGGGTLPASAPLVARARRRRSVRPDRRRARHRKVASDRGIPRKARRNAAHLGRMGRLAAPAEHAPASAHRMGQTTQAPSYHPAQINGQTPRGAPGIFRGISAVHLP